MSVYGPCQGPLSDDFAQWLYNLNIQFDAKWLILGDFNFMHSLENHNLPGVNVNDIFIPNEIIDHLGLVELPIKGRQYISSNMQTNPRLEQIDWFSPLWLGLQIIPIPWFCLLFVRLLNMSRVWLQLQVLFLKPRFFA